MGESVYQDIFAATYYQRLFPISTLSLKEPFPEPLSIDQTSCIKTKDMPSTHLFPLSLSLVTVLIAATYLFAAVCTTMDPDVSGLLSRQGVPPLYSDRPVSASAIVLPAALAPRGNDLDRRAQWNPHTSWPGHDNHDDGGGEYCGAVTKITVTAEEGPLASDCEAIRAWAGKPPLSPFFSVCPPLSTPITGLDGLGAFPWGPR